MRVWIEGTNEHRIVDLIRRQEKLPKAQQDTLNLCQALSTKSWVGYVDDTLICCWGLIPPTIMANTAYLWLYTTPAVTEQWFPFVRHSQRQIEVMLREYPTITGHCLADAERSIRWVRWLGGAFKERDSQGRMPFVIRNMQKEAA